ncbi:UNVERIFIED_CONTAM: hypothetical protein FKN15_055238 [Acipenser sinensis]
MAALQTLIPTPLVGKDFLKSTHMQLGLDFRQWGDTMKSTFKSHFLPVTATRLPLSQQPKPAQVEHKDLLQTKEFQSETCNAFSLKQLDPIERVPAWSRLTTNFRMHGDPRSDTFTTIHSSHFKPRLAGHIPSRTTVAYQKGGGYMGPVCGDREEFTLPLTEQSAYEGHDVRLHPTVRAPCKHLGKDFLKSTHMQLGLDFRQWGDTMKSTFKSHFLPVTATRLPLSQQPKPAQVEHKDLLQTKEFQSETCNAFSLKQLDPIERVPAWSRLTTNFRMHGDPRSDTFITIHSSHFKPRLAGHIPSRTTVAYQKGGGYVGPVCGDREEFTLPLTEQSAYEGHDVRLHPTVRAPCKHLGKMSFSKCIKNDPSCLSLVKVLSSGAALQF